MIKNYNNKDIILGYLWFKEIKKKNIFTKIIFNNRNNLVMIHQNNKI